MQWCAPGDALRFCTSALGPLPLWRTQPPGTPCGSRSVTSDDLRRVAQSPSESGTAECVGQAEDMEVQQHMTQKQRRSSRAVQAREAAREKAARFREQEDERLRIAQEAILLQEEIDEFDAETERLVADLRERRDGQLSAKRQKLEALVVDMLDTEVPAQQAAERLGMTVGQVRAAKRSFEQAVASLAAQSPEETVPAVTSEDARHGAASVPNEVPAEELHASAAGTSAAFSFPPPGSGSVSVPAQENSPEQATSTALPSGAAG